MALMRFHEDFPDTDVQLFPIYDIDFSSLAELVTPNVYASGGLNYQAIDRQGQFDMSAFPSSMPRHVLQPGNLMQNRNTWIETDGVFERENTIMTGMQVGVKPDDFDTKRWRYYSLYVSGDTPHRSYFAVTQTVNWSSTINYYRDDSTPENRLDRIFYADNGFGFSMSNGVYDSNLYRYTGLAAYHGGASVANNFVAPRYWHYNIGGVLTRWNFRNGSSSDALNAANGTIQSTVQTTSTANLEIQIPCINVIVRFTYEDVQYCGIMICRMSEHSEDAIIRSCSIRAVPVEMWGTSITDSNAPEWSGGDSSEQQGGLNGTWDYTGEAIPDTDASMLPAAFVSGSVIKCYAINDANLNHLAERLYNTDSSLWTAWSNKLYSPASALIALHYLPVEFSGSYDSSNLSRVSMAGQSLDTTGTYQAVNGYVQTDQWRDSPTYTLNVPKIADSFVDLAPFTRMTLHVPFCGTVQIDPARCTGGSISVRYRCDALTGNCSARITLTDRFGASTVMLALGNCAYTIPIMGRSGGAAGAALAGGVIGALGMVLTGNFIGAAAAAAGGVIADYSAQATQAQQIQRAGDTSPLLDLCLWLEISRAIPSTPADKQTLQGVPANVTRTLTELEHTGFVRCSDAHLQIDTATEGEIQEIYRLLRSGIILK